MNDQGNSKRVTVRDIAKIIGVSHVTVSLVLGTSLHRGSYRLVATSTDWAGNRQARARTAVLKVK